MLIDPVGNHAWRREDYDYDYELVNEREGDGWSKVCGCGSKAVISDLDVAALVCVVVVLNQLPASGLFERESESASPPRLRVKFKVKLITIPRVRVNAWTMTWGAGSVARAAR